MDSIVTKIHRVVFQWKYWLLSNIHMYMQTWHEITTPFKGPSLELNQPRWHHWGEFQRSCETALHPCPVCLYSREKEQHTKHLRQLEEEMETQVQKVEGRIRKEVHV